MTRIFNIFLSRNKQQGDAAYKDAEAFFIGLKIAEANAIRCLYAKISDHVCKIGKSYLLPDEDIEELIGDCIALCLLKIQDGEYVFQGYDPATYCVEIAKNKAKHFHRRHKKHRLIDWGSVPEHEVAIDITDHVSTEVLEKLLLQINENCRKLIQLKYLEELADKVVIEQQLTQYRTVDALKNQRARCMKRLTEIAHAGFVMKTNDLL